MSVPDSSAVAYRPPCWARSGHANTLAAALTARVPGSPPLRRERWDTPDGDFIDADFLDGPDEAPLVVLFHGLEGGSRSHYARALMAGLAALGWRGVLPHFRGCSGEPNRLARAYHSGDSAEIGWILARLRASAARATPLAAAGVSLGGNALARWMGEQGEAARPVLDAAAVVSAPLDLAASGDALARGFNRLYTREFLRTMKAKSEEKARRFPGSFDLHAMRRARTLREFDNTVTAPLHGFRDTDDYWSRASALPGLVAVRVPTLLLAARDDPFLPSSCRPGAAQLSSSILAEYPESGGHVGFVTGPFPGRVGWMPARILAFLAPRLRGGANETR